MVFLPLYLLVMNWVLLLEVSLYWVEYWIWEHLMYVLRWDICSDNGMFYWFTWYMFWHSTRGFSRWHWGNLRTGVDARSCLYLSGRNIGAIFEVICVGLSIMNMNLLWCYFSTNSWLDQSERIASCYFSTNSRIDRTKRIVLCYFSMNYWIGRMERIPSRWFRTLQTISSYVLC